MTQTRNTPASQKTLLEMPPDVEMDPRSTRARTEPMLVRPLSGSRYIVESESGGTYVVDLDAGRCTCPDHSIRDVRCKHIRRVAMEVTEKRVPPPGKRHVACAGCGTTLSVRYESPRPYLCPDCHVEPGDAVLDRRSGDLLIVVGVTDHRADEVEIDGADCTVAEYPSNADYDPSDPVIEVVYPPSGSTGANRQPRPLRRYSFPLSRLKRHAELRAGQSALSEFAETDPRRN